MTCLLIKERKVFFIFAFGFVSYFMGFVSYFMGITPCNIQISVQYVPGDFWYYPAPAGIFFCGESQSLWVKGVEADCCLSPRVRHDYCRNTYKIEFKICMRRERYQNAMSLSLLPWVREAYSRQ